MLTTPASTSAVNGRPPDPQPPEPITSAQPIPAAPLASAAPPEPQPNWQDLTYPTDQSQRPSNAQVPASAPPQQRIPVVEYQWGEELVRHLQGLPPRSNFGGKFSIIADPNVDNAMRAQVFTELLRRQGVPISERQSASRTQGTLHTHMLFFPCKCEDGCAGRFLLSVGDDTSHPYGILGQRIGVALYHPPSETPG